MDTDSTAVKDRTYLTQNVEERAPIDSSYKLKTDVAKYNRKTKDGWTSQPCYAQYSFDEYLENDSDVYGTYEITIGSRMYSTEFDT